MRDRYLVREARALGLEVIDRCNLTVLLEPGQEDLVQFLASNKVPFPPPLSTSHCVLCAATSGAPCARV